MTRCGRRGQASRPRRRRRRRAASPARPARRPVPARSTAATAPAAATDGGRRTRCAFHGEHQAGIVTPAQDRLHFVAFDVDHQRPGRAGRRCCRTGRPPRPRMTAGPGRRRGRRGRRRSPRRRRTTPARRSACRASRPDPDHRLRPDAVPRRRRRDRFGLAARRPAALADLPALPGRRARPGDHRRRPLRPGLRQRPAGRRARRPQPGPARASGVVSVRWSQLGFGRTSSTSQRAGHAAQPVRLQGRHRQPQGRGRRRCCATSSGSPPDDGRGLDGRRLLPGHPQDPDA